MARGRRKRTTAKSTIENVPLSEQDDNLNSPARKENKMDHATRAKLNNSGGGRAVSKSTVCITSFFPTQTKNASSIDKSKEKSSLTTPNKYCHKKENVSEIDTLDQSIVPDAGQFKTDETPVAVPIHSPSTPHRINMPSTEIEEIINESTNNKIGNEPMPVGFVCPVKSIGKKPGIRGRKKSNQNRTANRLADSSLTETTNHKLTDYFPVRRSVRKCKKTVMEEKQREIQNKVVSQVEDGLEIRHFPGKGRGIITTREFAKGEFVVEYIGELIDQVTAKKREVLYAQDQNTGCYMYYFQHRNHQYCVDATAETEKLGRLVNHSRNGNLIARVIEVESVPHLVLTAKEDIPMGVEVTYDYGDRSRESIRNHPWLAL